MKSLGLGGGVAKSDITAQSSYGAIKTTATAPATTVAVQAFATGTATLTMSNLSTTAAEYCIIGIGESLLDAEANRDGSETIVVRANSDLEKRVPAGATHYAWKSASGAPALYLGENV